MALAWFQPIHIFSRNCSRVAKTLSCMRFIKSSLISYCHVLFSHIYFTILALQTISAMVLAGLVLWYTCECSVIVLIRWPMGQEGLSSMFSVLFLEHYKFLDGLVA